MSTYNWSQLILDVLIEGLKSSKDTYNGWVTVLAYCLCEEMKLIDPSTKVSFPRFMKWDLKKLNQALKKIDLEKFDQKMIVDDIPPTAEELRLVESELPEKEKELIESELPKKEKDEIEDGGDEKNNEAGNDGHVNKDTYDQGHFEATIASVVESGHLEATISDVESIRDAEIKKLKRKNKDLTKKNEELWRENESLKELRRGLEEYMKDNEKRKSKVNKWDDGREEATIVQENEKAENKTEEEKEKDAAKGN